MRFKGLALSLDALFALAFAAVILSLPAVVSHNSASYSGFDQLSTLGRDYLVLKYYHNKSITTENFGRLARHTLVESEPSDINNYWVAAFYYQYPNFFNCSSSTSCSFANTSSNANFSNSQDLGLAHKYAVWVRP